MEVFHDRLSIRIWLLIWPYDDTLMLTSLGAFLFFLQAPSVTFCPIFPWCFSGWSDAASIHWWQM